MSEAKLHKAIGAIETNIKNIMDGQQTRDAASKDRDDVMTNISASLASTATILKRLEPLVDSHEKIASSISVEYLPQLDKHHAFTAKQIQQKEFWEAAQNRLKEKGLLILLLCAIAGVLYTLGFSEEARKILGL